MTQWFWLGQIVVSVADARSLFHKNYLVIDT